MADDEQNGEFIRIYNKDIYNKVLSVEEKVANLGSDVGVIKEQVTGLNKSFGDYGERVRGLELKFYGVVAGLIMAIGLLVYALVIH